VIFSSRRLYIVSCVSCVSTHEYLDESSLPVSDVSLIYE